MAAEEIIGGYQQGDSPLDIAAIADRLPATAEELQAILRDPEVAGLNRQRKADSKESASYKLRSRQLAAAVVVGSGIAALASGFLLYGQGHETGAVATGLVDLVTKNTTAITVVQILALLAATAASYIISARNYGKLWTDARRRAETRRIAIFNSVLERVSARPGTGPDSLLAQALAFFVRYQLDLQIDFYDKARGVIDKSADAVLLSSAVFSGLTAVVGLIGGLSVPGALVLGAFLGIATPVILSALQSWASATRPEAKSESYRAAHEALTNLRLGLGKVIASASSGNVAEVKAFTDNVHSVMSAENGAFAGLGPLPPPPDAG